MFLLMVCLAALSQEALAQTTNYKSYAILVSGIAKNFRWPDYSGNFEIMVFGNSKVIPELEAINSQKKVEGLDIVVTNSENLSDIDSPKIIYLSDGKSSMLSEIAAKVSEKPTVIISEREGLFKKGAEMSFVINSQNQLRLDINQSGLSKKNIKVPTSVLTMLVNEKI